MKNELQMSDLINVFLKEKNGCWIYLQKTGLDGYPFLGGKIGYRYIYETFNGVIPEGYLIRHICNERRCLNPKHLLLGTQKENMQDRGLSIKTKWILEGFMENGKEDDKYGLRIKLEKDFIWKLKLKCYQHNLSMKEFIWKTIKKNLK